MTEQEKALATLPQAGNLMSGSQFQQMLAVSEFLAKSDLIPQHFRGKSANVFVALEMALRQNMSPFMVMQNLYVVHGRPGLEAKLVIALLNQNGGYDQELSYDITRNKDNKIVSCTAWTMKNGRRIDGPPVTAEMVRGEKWDQKEGSKWLTMPEIMYRYRAATFFTRVNNPGVLMGLQTAEEIEDVVEMVPTPGTAGGEFFAPLPQEEVEEGQDAFAALVQSRGAESVLVDKFVDHCAEVYKMSSAEIKAKASINPDNFFGAFGQWAEKQGEKKTRKKAKKEESAFTNSCLQHGNFEGDECPECAKEVKETMKTKPIPPEHIEKIRFLLKSKPLDEAQVCQEYEVEKLEDLTWEAGLNVMEWLSKVK